MGVMKDMQLEHHERQQWVEWGSASAMDSQMYAACDRLFSALFHWHQANKYLSSGMPDVDWELRQAIGDWCAANWNCDR
jgi:hypothetical protein